MSFSKTNSTHVLKCNFFVYQYFLIIVEDLETSDHALQKTFMNFLILSKLYARKTWSKKLTVFFKDIATHLRSGNDVSKPINKQYPNLTTYHDYDHINDHRRGTQTV